MAFRLIKLLAWCVALAVVMAAAAGFNNELMLPGDAIAPVWLPIGLALAAILLWGRHLWPGVLMGLLVAYLVPGMPLQKAVFMAAVDAIQILWVSALTWRWIGQPFALANVRDVVKFLLGVLLACGLGAGLLLIGPFDATAANILAWWLSHVNGMILIVPLMVSWFHPRTMIWSLSVFLELIALIGCTVGMSGAIFAGWLPHEIAVSLPYLLMLLLVWPALRFNRSITFHTTILIVAIAWLETAMSQGAFASLLPQSRLLALQCYLVVIGVLGLILGEIVPEKRIQRKQLEEAHAALTQREQEHIAALEKSRSDLLMLIENTSYSIWSVDCDFRIVTFNSYFAREFERQWGFPLEPGQDTLAMLPDEIAACWRNWFRRALDGVSFTTDYPQTAQDGVHYFKVAFHPVHRENQVIGAVAFAWDITETQYLLNELSASEARWRALLQNAPMMVTMTDLDGKILAINRSFSPDKAVEELVGEYFYPYLPPENQTLTQQASQEALRSGGPQYFELAFSWSDGSQHWMANHVVPVIQDEKPLALIFLATDITERKAAEERLRGIIENAPFGAHSYELQPSGALIFSGFNPAADRILGVSHAPMMAKTIEEAFPGLAATSIPDIYRHVAASGERFYDEQVIYNEGQIQGAFEVHAFQTLPNRMTVFFRDITERKKAEAIVHQSQAMLAKAQQIAHLGSYELNFATNGVRWSDEVFRIWGYTGDQPPSHEWMLSQVHPQDQAQVMDAIKNARTRGQSFSIDYRIVREAGEVRWLHDIAEIALDETNKATMCFGTVLDITERMQAQEQVHQMNEELEQRVRQRTAELEASNRQLEATNRELESFSYTISHDLRSPLRAIDGFSLILMEQQSAQLPDEALRWLKAIRSNAQQMGRLIDDLLAFAHLGRQSINRRTVNMDELINLAWITLEPDVADRPVALTIAPLPPCSGDPNLLLQVWVNLLSNALKFTRERSAAQIDIQVVQRADEVIFSVRDNGAGFDMQYVDKLFGVFQRLHAEDKYEGTGVGLAMVERIIRKHGGRVWAEGQEDQGATFYFSLPVL